VCASRLKGVPTDLMDIQLPDIDGIMALGQIREEQALDATPVLAVSASVMPDEQQRSSTRASTRSSLSQSI
jgi:CheY-like chemotaxis protein